MRSHDDNHGKTVAAWTGVLIMLIGFVVSGIAVLIAKPVIFWIGALIIALGGVAGAILRSAGYGQGATARHPGGR